MNNKQHSKVPFALKILILQILFLTVFSFTACGLEGEAAQEHLTAKIILPGEGKSLNNPEVDPTVTIPPRSGSPRTVPMKAGQKFGVTIPFNSQNGNVVGAGIRFGNNGPIRTVPVNGALGQRQGTLQFDAQIPPEVCNNLSNICHQIECYEFVVTSEGRVSKSRATDMAVLCGGCDELSCKGLLDNCPRPPGAFCSSSVGAGPTCVDFCIDQSQGTCWYEVKGRRFDCSGSCLGTGGNQLTACAKQATNYAYTQKACQ